MGNRWMQWLVAAIGGIVLAAAPALAMPYRDGSELAMQRVLDGQDQFRGMNASTDIRSGGGPISSALSGESTFTIVAEGAGFRDRNIFGVYSGNRLIDLFAGEAQTGDTITVNIEDVRSRLGSDSFGFYLKSPQGWFFADPAKNSDGLGHMVAYEGSGRDLLIGFEDLNGGGDLDFEDFVVRVSARGTDPAPVPEPTTLLLLGSGMLGLAFARKARR